MSYNSKYKGAEVDTLLDKINDFDPSNKVDKTGDTMSGGLTATFFQTGDNESNYFRCRKLRGEGDATVYYHAIDFGYPGNNKTDFYEYSGIWNFYQNQTEDGSGKILVGSITPNGWVGNVVGDVTGKAS